MGASALGIRAGGMRETAIAARGKKLGRLGRFGVRVFPLGDQDRSRSLGGQSKHEGTLHTTGTGHRPK